VTVDVGLDDSGRIDRFAQEVKACALGQASAAILGAGAIGASQEDLELATGAFRSMLKAGGPAPAGRFSDLAMLAPVKDYPARHASTLLAFEAALEAVRRGRARTSPAGAA
jgi:NifU-like protein involved in Fe-S cluster formation